MVTVNDLKKLIADLPGDATVRGYEGEGGAWIVVDRGEETLLAINTDTGEVRREG
jgi:hypothetical protein